MGGDTGTPSGPDLVAGVRSEEIAEGSSIAGRVGDQSVLLVRSAGRCYAIGARCSHYGGPLVEGLVVDGTVRCPWHHAAFRLDTGEAVRPPAYGALPCWRVEEDNGTVRVLERREVPAAPREAAPGIVTHVAVLIIGAGPAGVTAADTLRKEGHVGRITIVDADESAPVDRPNLSKDYLAGTAPAEWVTLRTDDWFRERDITLLRPRRVTALDLTRRQATLDDGSSQTFDRLLIATGSSPIVPMSGAGQLPVFTLRSLADSKAIMAAADKAGAGATVVVLGASFLALEVSASLRARGMEVHVVAPHTYPLVRVLGPEIGAWIHDLHVEHGVHFHLGANRKGFQADGVLLDNGELLRAAFVVAAIGVRANTELARVAGLRIDRGVVVDAMLRASVPGVYAAGDVACYPDARTKELVTVEHWVAAQRQGQAAARNMIGWNEPFTAPPFFWSAHYDVTISYVGHAEQWDRIETTGSLEERDCEVRYIAGSRVLAVATIGRDRVSLERELEMEREVTGRARSLT